MYNTSHTMLEKKSCTHLRQDRRRRFFASPPSRLTQGSNSTRPSPPSSSVICPSPALLSPFSSSSFVCNCRNQQSSEACKHLWVHAFIGSLSGGKSIPTSTVPRTVRRPVLSRYSSAWIAKVRLRTRDAVSFT